MTRRAAFREQAWPEDQVFRDLALQWAESVSECILDWVWRAFDVLRTGPMTRADLSKPLEQLERDLTDLHFQEIQRLWAGETDGFPAFFPDHEIPEFESRHSARAQPPSYDLGFVLDANRRIIGPLEAKVVPKPSALREYLIEVRSKFVRGIAAPLVDQAGIIGYLLSGSPHAVFSKLESELSQTLKHPSTFDMRDHRTSFHNRGKSPFGRDLPDLLLHHLVMPCF